MRKGIHKFWKKTLKIMIKMFRKEKKMIQIRLSSPKNTLCKLMKFLNPTKIIKKIFYKQKTMRKIGFKNSNKLM